MTLADAVALTLLAAEKGSTLFEPMARQWVARLLAETEPRLRDLAAAVWLFEDVAAGRLTASKALAPLERGSRREATWVAGLQALQ